MKEEAPVISKALKLVSFAIIISLVAIGISAGYSAYEEYSALAQLATTSSSGVNFQFNGSTMTISALVPNKMVYPVDLKVHGNVSFQNDSVAFQSQGVTLEPNQEKPVQFNINLNFSQLLQDQSTLDSMLFNSSELRFKTTVSAKIQPLLGIGLTKSFTRSVGPILGGFNATIESSQASLSPDGKDILVPVVLSWNNSSPVTFQGMMNVTISQIPNRPAGNYGGASGPFSLVQGANSKRLIFSVPVTDISGGLHGNYTFDFLLTSTGMSISFQKTVEA